MLKIKKDNIIFVFRIVSIMIIIICLAVLESWNKQNKENGLIIDELKEFSKISDDASDIIKDATQENSDNKTEETSETQKETNPNEAQNEKVDFEKLKEKNSDTVAWIKMPNTNIDFPVVQARDNSYYLTRNFYKESNGAGWIFADYRCDFSVLNQNTIIYGHNRRNGTMFSKLVDVLDKKQDNLYIYFDLPNESYIAEVFSIYKINAKDLTLKNEFTNNEEFKNYINEMKSRSTKKYNVEIAEQDKILTLCTCDNITKNRVVVCAKLNKK